MIARAVRKLAKLVRGDRPAPVVPGFLRPIDTDALARELNLLAMAADRGASDLPRTDESALDGVEQKIIQRVESVWAWQGDELIKQLRAYASRLTGYSVQAE